jgi:hypothetical protein
MRVSFSPRTGGPVAVEVFQTSHGSDVFGQRLVARFRSAPRALSWDGRANVRGRRVSDGMFFVRITARKGARRDVRRVTLQRVRGRFRSRPSFYRRASCGLVSSFKIERPVFGGRNNRAVDVSYRLGRTALATIEVFRGKRLVLRNGPSTRRANRSYRLRLASEKRAHGDYRVRLVAVAGGERLTTTLVTRRI